MYVHESLQRDFKSVIKIRNTDNHSANLINCTVVINMRKDMFCVYMGYMGILVNFTQVIKYKEGHVCVYKGYMGIIVKKTLINIIVQLDFGWGRCWDI